MALTPFTREFGLTQGRIKPTGWTLAEGEWAVVLGSDVPGRKAVLAHNDAVVLAQTAESTAPILRARIKVRPHGEPHPNVLWIAGLLVTSDGEGTLSYAIVEEREYSDIAFRTVNQIGNATQIWLMLQPVFDGAATAELELPGAYFGALSEETPEEDVVVANRIPEPGWTGVSRSSTIQLDILDVTGDGISFDECAIYVNDVLAWSGEDNEAKPGFDGPGSNWTSPFVTDYARIILDPTEDFASGEVVNVRVVAASAGGAPVEQTYSFTVEDFEAPTIVEVIATTDSAVRVRFSEDVKQVDAAAANDALNPGNWAITILQDAIAVWVTVAEVTSVAPDTVELHTDIPMTAGAAYQVAATSIEDTSGNALSGTETGSFVAVGEQALGRNFDVIELIPPTNVDHDTSGDLRRFMAIFQEVVALLLRRVDRWTDIIDIDRAPDAFVDAILQDLGNPFQFDLSTTDKRRLARVLVPIYRSKGTARGIRNAIRFFLGLELTIQYPNFVGKRLDDAHLGDGEDDLGTFVLGGGAYSAYSYEIHSAEALDDETRERVRAIATYMQVAHEHLVRIVEPGPPAPEVDHLSLGLSQLDVNWILH